MRAVNMKYAGTFDLLNSPTEANEPWIIALGYLVQTLPFGGIVSGY